LSLAPQGERGSARFSAQLEVRSRGITSLSSALSCALVGALFYMLNFSAELEARPPIRVAIDPGHGGRNIGSIDPWRPYNTEKVYTLIIAKKIRRYLKSAGVKVWMTRERDEPLTLQERMRSASARGVDLYVSVHINDSRVIGPRGHGTFFLARAPFDESRLRLRDFNKETKGKVLRRNLELTQPNKLSSEALKKLSPLLLDLIHEGAHQESLHLAHIVNSALEEFTPFGSRGVKQADFGVLKGNSMAAIVCEVGFINHPREGPFVTSSEGMEQVARGISLGVIRYLSLRHQLELSPPPQLKAPSEAQRRAWLKVKPKPRPSKEVERLRARGVRRDP